MAENESMELEYEEDEIQLVTLIDEDGNENEFEYLDTVQYNDAEYVVLLPFEGEGDEDEEVVTEVLILKVETDEDDPEEENWVRLDSEEEMNAVFELFKSNNEDLFDFEEE